MIACARGSGGRQRWDISAVGHLQVRGGLSQAVPGSRGPGFGVLVLFMLQILTRCLCFPSSHIFSGTSLIVFVGLFQRNFLNVISVARYGSLGPKLRWGLSWSVASLLLAVGPTHRGPLHLLHAKTGLPVDRTPRRLSPDGRWRRFSACQTRRMTLPPGLGAVALHAPWPVVCPCLGQGERSHKLRSRRQEEPSPALIPGQERSLRAPEIRSLGSLPPSSSRILRLSWSCLRGH